MIFKLGQKVTETDFTDLVNSLDLFDISKYIISLKDLEWVPSVYFKPELKSGEIILRLGDMYWSVFSYLTIKKILLIENQYSRTEKDFYVDYRSYYNPLESLYEDIISKLVENGFISTIRVQRVYNSVNNFKQEMYNSDGYVLSISNIREKLLLKIGI